MIALLGADPRYTAVGLLAIMLAALVLAGRPRTRSDAPRGAARRSTTEPTERVAE